MIGRVAMKLILNVQEELLQLQQQLYYSKGDLESQQHILEYFCGLLDDRAEEGIAQLASYQQSQDLLQNIRDKRNEKLNECFDMRGEKE